MNKRDLVFNIMVKLSEEITSEMMVSTEKLVVGEGHTTQTIYLETTRKICF